MIRHYLKVLKALSWTIANLNLTDNANKSVKYIKSLPMLTLSGNSI